MHVSLLAAAGAALAASAIVALLLGRASETKKARLTGAPQQAERRSRSR
jgi:hypothetical protein